MIRGRSQTHNGYPMCHKADVIEMAAKVNANIANMFCQSQDEDGNTFECECRKKCAYFKQFQRKWKHIFMPHDYAFLKLSKQHRHPNPIYRH